MDHFLLLFIIVQIYILILFILRFFNFRRKKKCKGCNNCCPDCGFSLQRIKRTTKDNMVNNLTLRIFDSKRYTCTECGWMGLRWEDTYKIK